MLIGACPLATPQRVRRDRAGTAGLLPRNESASMQRTGHNALQSAISKPEQLRYIRLAARYRSLDALPFQIVRYVLIRSGKREGYHLHTMHGAFYTGKLHMETGLASAGIQMFQDTFRHVVVDRSLLIAFWTVERVFLVSQPDFHTGAELRQLDFRHNPRLG